MAIWDNFTFLNTQETQIPGGMVINRSLDFTGPVKLLYWWSQHVQTPSSFLLHGLKVLNNKGVIRYTYTLTLLGSGNYINIIRNSISSL